MANIMDYLDWRGDLTLEVSPFNEVDNLVLSQLSYIEFRDIIPGDFGDEVSLIDAAERYLSADDYESRSNIGPLISKDTFELLKKMTVIRRYRDMRLTGYRNQIDPETEKQFAAMTILMPDNTIFIAFRGTDSTLIGWKEDFNMSFLSTIPSQKSAANYLAEAADYYPQLIRVGGHSKGGNLAVFSALFSDERIQKRILNVYSNDGPGFPASTAESLSYSNMEDRICTIVPKSSIVGMLLEHSEKYEIVDSTQTGIFQHDPFSWQVRGDHFVKMENVSKDSRFIDQTLREWVAAMDRCQMEMFVDGLFELIEVTDSKTLGDFSEARLKKAALVLKSWKNMDEDTKKAINETVRLLMQLTKKNLFKNIEHKKMEHKRIYAREERSIEV